MNKLKAYLLYRYKSFIAYIHDTWFRWKHRKMIALHKKVEAEYYAELHDKWVMHQINLSAKRSYRAGHYKPNYTTKAEAWPKHD